MQAAALRLARRMLPLFAVSFVVAGVPAQAADDNPTAPQCHPAGNSALRSRSPLASAALEFGMKHSPSMQALVASLQDTDVVAYIDSDLKPLGETWGHVSFISKTITCRYLRIAITAHINLSQAASLLAHELQHVFEIASHPEVVNEATLSEMYLQFGHRARYANSYDSLEAVEMGSRVAAEIFSGGVVAPSARSSQAEPAR